ncbi:MAG TPA: transglutaminase-like domain-containing protein, partial [Candidatus Entotheonella sp.]
IDLAPGSRYTDVLGAGDRMPIQRQRRITLSRRVVATLTSTASDRDKGAPMYLRTQVMTTYQNGQWTSDASAPQPLMGSRLPNGNSGYQMFSAFDGYPSNAPVPSKDRHDVRLLVNLPGAVPLPYSAQRVSTPATLSCMMTAEDLLQCTPAAQRVAYSIEHQAWRPSIPYGIGAALHPRSRATSEPGFLHAVKRARSAPEDVLAPLRPLAQQLVGPEPLSPLGAAQKVQDYFRRQYVYSLDVNLAKEGDPIVDFVLHRRPAYCEYFASGMVLLLRAVNIPARVIGGFVVGEYYPWSGQWVIRQRDAHAWAEVFDAASGRWVAFDATPPVATQTLKPKGLVGLINQGLVWTELHLYAVMTQVNPADFKTGLKDRLHQSLAYLYRPYTLAIAGIITALTWLLIRWRQGRLHLSWRRAWRRRKHRSPALHPEPIAAEAQQQFARVALILEQWGWPIGVAETLQDYLDRVTPQCHASGQADTALVPALHHFAQAYTRLRFQPHPTNPETTVCSTTQEQLTRLQYWADQVV